MIKHNCGVVGTVEYWIRVHITLRVGMFCLLGLRGESVLKSRDIHIVFEHLHASFEIVFRTSEKE